MRKARAKAMVLYNTILNNLLSPPSKFSMIRGAILKKNERILDPNTEYTDLYVKNLSLDITEEFLILKFSEYEEISNATISRDTEGKYKGFGFVNFEKPESAKKALEKMNGVKLESGQLYVARAQRKSERHEMLRQFFEEKNSNDKKSNLYVKNLTDDVDEQILKNYFSPYGVITSVKVMRTEKSINKGFGFVCYRNSDEASIAVRETNGRKFHGKPLVVCLAQEKENRKIFLQSQMLNNIAHVTPVILPIGCYPSHPGYYAASPPAHPGFMSLPHQTMMVPHVYPSRPMFAP
ncbi:hypothetical protein ZOSMA_159G00380 [Zostera marina]|uniref:RRM domain-containing protein n=1 Tax=Zostera marina TaxID=29655 RepID=A0A0K9PV08_ZOSMR|nr:hypothetical protein ZOSMA_159G00380 [Zostera marina]